MGKGFDRRTVYKDESEVGLMLGGLINILKSYDALEYRIVEEKTQRIESYYVKKQLELNRGVEVTHIYLTVYKIFSEDGKKYRGSSQTEIHPAMSGEEVRKAVDEALYAAGFVKNEYFPLAEKSDEAVEEVKSGIAAIGLYDTLEKLRNAVYAEDRYNDGYLSFSEFFVYRKDARIINSVGVDVSFTYYAAEMEMAVNWKDGKEIEIYESYTLADCDTKLLAGRVEKLFEVASKKPSAKMTPSVKDIDVLLTGECLKDFFTYYCFNANAMAVYNRVSTFKTGEELQGDTVKGDRVTVALDPYLVGSSESKPYDNDGFPLKKVELIKDGRLLRYWGDVRFSSYLGIPPTGNINNYIVMGGTKTLAEMKSGPYLELVSFSGFQTDPVTGDFASEIRLGFYFDGKDTVTVTGGSVSGNIKKVHGDMWMSVERAQYNNYSGPLSISIRNVSIAGS